MELREVLWKILTSCGPWRLEDLLRELQRQTHYQKINYPYYLEKHLREWEAIGRIVISDDERVFLNDQLEYDVI